MIATLFKMDCYMYDESWTENESIECDRLEMEDFTPEEALRVCQDFFHAKLSRYKFEEYTDGVIEMLDTQQEDRPVYKLVLEEA